MLIDVFEIGLDQRLVSLAIVLSRLGLIRFGIVEYLPPV
jgi:hypothetical protein